MKNYKENYDYYNVEKVDSIKQLLESAAADAGDKIAFKYKENKDVKCVTYNNFWKMFIVWVLLYFLSI